MAPSNKLTLIALLVAFAVVAPSAAIRDGGAATDAPPAPAPSATVQPMSILDDIIGDLIHFRIPDLPLPPILPCPPDFPIKMPFIPCYDEAKPVPECRSSLSKYMPPCAGFLTDADNGSASSPPSECCDAIGSFFNDHSTTPFCLCHVVNGDFGELLQAPMNHTRANSILQQCGLELSSAQVSNICTGKTMPNIIPPMDAPSPPPTWRHH